MKIKRFTQTVFPARRRNKINGNRETITTLRRHRFGIAGTSRLGGLPAGVVLLASLFTLPASAIATDASRTLTPTTAQLHQVISAHYRAIEDNQLDRAMRFYHRQSPERAQARKNIALGLTQFLLKPTILNFCYDGRKGQYALATAKHKFLRISGIKFTIQIVDVAYRLREERGKWKIWTRRNTADRVAPLSNCKPVGHPVRASL